MDEEKNNFDQNQQNEATDSPEAEKKLGENNVPTQPSPQEKNQVPSGSYENPHSVKDNSQYNQNLEKQKTQQAQTQYQAPQGQYQPPQGQAGQYQQPGQAPQGQYQAPQGQAGQYQQTGQTPQGQYQAPQGQAGQYQQARQAPQGQYQQPGQTPQGQGPYNQYGQPASGKKPDGLAIASLVLGIAGILGSFLIIYAFIGTILGIVGLILAIISRKNNGKTGISTGGLITSIIAIILTLIVTISCYACACTTKKAFDDLDGYEFWEEFEDYDWEKEFEDWD